MTKNNQFPAIAKNKKDIANAKNNEALKYIQNQLSKEGNKKKLVIASPRNTLQDIVERSYFYKDIGGLYKSEAMVDSVSYTVSLIDLEALLTKKEIRENPPRAAFFEYNPQIKAVTSENENGHPVLNLYEPAIWRRDEYYFQAEQVIELTMPEIYIAFFMHLVDNDKQSFEKLIQWLSYSLIGRNPTYLVLVGGKGVGKTVLANHILLVLHGKKNFVTMSNDTFKNQFNSEIEGHTIGYIDELYMKKNARQQIAKLKLLNNDEVRREKKGVDASMIPNHINIYISSNDYEGIPLESDNRRLTIPNCTNTPLKDTPLDKRFDEIIDEKNIIKLGQYLLGIQPTYEEVRDPFVSPIVEEKIWDANAKEWETWAHEWCLVTLHQLRKKGEVRLERFQSEFNEKHRELNIVAPGQVKVERFLKENESLGWYLKKHPTKTKEGIKAYRSFERIND